MDTPTRRRSIRGLPVALVLSAAVVIGGMLASRILTPDLEDRGQGRESQGPKTQGREVTGKRDTVSNPPSARLLSSAPHGVTRSQGAPSDDRSDSQISADPKGSVSPPREPAFDLDALRHRMGVVGEAYLVREGLPRQTARELLQRGAEFKRARAILRIQAKYDGWSAAELREARFELQTAVVRDLGEQRYRLMRQARLEPSALFVDRVPADSEARRLGLVQGDRIVRYAGEYVFSPDDLKVLEACSSGPIEIEIEIERGGKRSTQLVTSADLGITAVPGEPPLLVGVDLSGDRPVQFDFVDPDTSAAIQVELDGSGRLPVKGGKIVVGKPETDP